MKVMITGGTGSLGTALTRHYIGKGEEVLVFSRDEFKQYEMALAYSKDKAKLEHFHLAIGDVRDYQRVRQVMAEHMPDVVIHAAALKQVPLGAHDPGELIKTNVLGTENVFRAAVEQNVGKVLLVSSDKAVRPTTLYGATKMLAERVMMAMDGDTTRLGAVRYGNVLGSRGSVLPLWLAQADRAELLALTNPHMTRFFFTMYQAVDFIDSTLAKLELGDNAIHVPLLAAMGMADFAECIGEVQLVGLRPGGEKMHEQLVAVEESVASAGEPYDRGTGDRVIICSRGTIGFSYDSTRPREWISKQTMTSWIEEFKTESAGSLRRDLRR